ncbi:hypothetical protein H8A97_00055 [Bradyrhizobium sp. Arg62]|uniref:hypothetical protein n=1 Tax=Bradyrhizobium brasilense TaxID=1419277 RepID=UPI001E344AE2|nr:hypothetical protein [Bradyrhizobium brasilense]MCC8943534.1 hypothetical protein [Bradyrhizobium brasilense]
MVTKRFSRARNSGNLESDQAIEALNQYGVEMRMTTIDRDAYRDQYTAMGGMFGDSAAAASGSGATGQPMGSDTAPPQDDTPPQHDGSGTGTPSTGSQASGGDAGSNAGGGGGSDTGGGGTTTPPGQSGQAGLPGLGDLLGGDGGLNLAGNDGTLQPVFTAVNGAVNDVNADVLDPVGQATGQGDLLHDVTGLAGTIGLGEIGVPTPATDGHTNLLTDVLNAPGTLLGGGGLGTVLSEVGSDLDDIVHSVDGVVGSLTGDNGLVSSLLGDTGLGSLLGGAGTTNPVTRVVQTVDDMVGSLLGDTGVGSLLGAGTGALAPVTDVVHAADGVVGSLLGDTGVGSLLGGTDALSPVTGLLGNVLHDAQTLPLLSINGGNNASDGGLLSGLLGDLNHSNTGHLADIDVGPTQPNGNAINLLAAPTSGDHHTVEVNAVDVGQSGPHLLDIGALTGTNGLNIPSLGGTGADGLAGNLLGNLDLGHLAGGSVASGNTASAPVSVPVDISNVLHDLVSGPLAADHGVLNGHGTHLL